MQFDYFGRQLSAYGHLYNSTALNERSIELAVALDFMAGRDPVNGLEIGNVLAHYDVGGHVVVDPYEQPTLWQANERWPYHAVDVFDVATQVGSSWDWIVSISTLEHVRWDMDPSQAADPEGSLRAINYLHDMLAVDGQMLVTVPCGFHPLLDEAITEELTGATRSCTFVRTHGDQPTWVQTDEPTVLPYGMTGPWAESVWVGEFERR